MKKLIVLAAGLLSIATAHAADLTTKAPLFSNGYPSTRCGAYYGAGIGGNAGAVNGAVVGTQIVQGDISAIIGYGCPFAVNAFWFVEGQFGISNLNGNVNGLALSGPMVAIERFGVGSPLNSMLGSLLPGVNSLAMPSLPLLPPGLTTSPGNTYAFMGLVEQDIGPQVAALSGHQWVVAPLMGLGMLTRVSNGSAIDVWAGWQLNSSSFCPGGGTICGKLGNMARVGTSIKF